MEDYVNFIVLGKIIKEYGVLGWLKIISLTEHDYSIFNYQPWFVVQNCNLHKIVLENWQRHNKGLIIKIKNVSNRDDAAYLKNSDIIINVNQLPCLTFGEYYWHDLIGCRVLNIFGIYLGIVVNLIETGSNDVLVVRYTKKYSVNYNIQEYLIPFIEKEVIRFINIQERCIYVNWD